MVFHIFLPFPHCSKKSHAYSRNSTSTLRRTACCASRNREFSWTLDPANSHAAGPIVYIHVSMLIQGSSQRGLILYSVYVLYMLYILLNILLCEYV